MYCQSDGSISREQPTKKSDALPPRNRERRRSETSALGVLCAALCTDSNCTLAVDSFILRRLKRNTRETFIAKSGAAACRREQPTKKSGALRPGKGGKK